MLTVKITRPGVVKQSKAGNPYTVQTGTCLFLGRDGQPEETPRIIEFMTDVSYPAGEYTISPASFGVGQYDKLEIKRLVLSPSGAGAKSPAIEK